MNRSGYADLPLHYGQVPPWLAQRMAKLGGAIAEAVVQDYGKSELIKRMSDPLWFQALGCVLGMDWHSSGITTSVLGALKKSVNPISPQLGIYICGGRGRFSRQTPDELRRIADATGLDGQKLVRASRLSAKVDNTAIQDGYQLYIHSFILSDTGEWAVVQQGMNDSNGMARRYHWHSAQMESFINEPHTFIYGQNQGEILNLTDKDAHPARNGILQIAGEGPERMLPEARKILMPRHHDVRKEDVNLKRLGAVLALSQEKQTQNFEDLLLLEGLGPRTLQSLTLVSEVIHGTPSRFNDPARFSFAHGGKDGHPFPVPTRVYDETINAVRTAVDKAKIDLSDKAKAIKSLHTMALQVEKDFVPNDNFDALIAKEQAESYQYGGRTVMGWAKPPSKAEPARPRQLDLFNDKPLASAKS